MKLKKSISRSRACEFLVAGGDGDGGGSGDRIRIYIIYPNENSSDGTRGGGGVVGTRWQTSYAVINKYAITMIRVTVSQIEYFHLTGM